MLRQVLLDQLSEFLMVEQGGLELYRVAASRAPNPKMRAKYEEFGRETAHHRMVLVGLITRLGGDPDHISPTARVAQFKAAKLLESSLAVDGLSEQEIALNDLENVLLAETKDRADWELLRRMADHASRGGLGGVVEKAGAAVGAGATAVAGGDPDTVDMELLAEALRDAVDEVGDEEDEHLAWARETHAEMSLRLGSIGPAPDRHRYAEHVTQAGEPVEERHAAPMTRGLLESAALPQWIPSPVTRELESNHET